MNILPFHTLFTSSSEGWDALAGRRASRFRRFAMFAAPFSLIPPLMLEYAGRHLGATLLPSVEIQAWNTAALFFLLAELATVPLMAWAIRSIALSKGVAADEHDAFTLATVAPIPLWLSALVLFIPNPLAIVAGLVFGLAASVLLIFRGVQSVLDVDEPLIALDIAYVVTALGLVAWVVLVMLGLLPVLS